MEFKWGSYFDPSISVFSENKRMLLSHLLYKPAVFININAIKPEMDVFVSLHPAGNTLVTFVLNCTVIFLKNLHSTQTKNL